MDILSRIFGAAAVLFLGLAAVPAKAESTGAPACAGLLAAIGRPAPLHREDGRELCARGYVLFYVYQTKVAWWVVERLTPAALEGPARRDDARFRPSPEIPDSVQAGLRDYKGSGYDRGHLAPAADMKWDQTALEESFYLTNVAPQVGAGFNRGIWAALEDKVRVWVRARGELYVVTGPIYGDETARVGAVAVPAVFYKIVYDPRAREALAFLVPNAGFFGNDFSRFQGTVDEVEAAAGIDFLAALDDLLEDRIESTVAEPWK